MNTKRLLYTLLAVGLIPSAISLMQTVAGACQIMPYVDCSVPQRQQKQPSVYDLMFEPAPIYSPYQIQPRVPLTVAPYPDYGLSNNDPYNLYVPPPTINVEPHTPQQLELTPLPNPYEDYFNPKR